MQIQHEDTAVDPRTRLAHYLEYSEYPPHSQPANALTGDLGDLLPSRYDASDSGRITGWDGEALRAGSLRIGYRVAIASGGRYTFETLVYADSKKLIHPSMTVDLSVGEHRLEFELAGRLLRKSSSGSPFELPGIVAERVPSDSELEAMASGRQASPEGRLTPYRKEYRTGSYKSESFSDAIWDSPEKRRKIAGLEAEIREWDSTRAKD
ncbi:MAG: hypothetical protein HS115_02570 [Spirochaetales bacterium]|nr:hypothetical protein [Spirochaetales bacterium]